MKQSDFELQKQAAFAAKRAKLVAYERERSQLHQRDLAELERMKFSLLQADVYTYSEWLTGYVNRGGAPTHFYEYLFPADRWFLAVADMVMYPLYGATAIHVIIPPGIKVVGEYGHNRLFWLDGYKTNSAVPVYSDTTILE